MTTAYIHFLSGEFDKSAEILTAALSDESADVSHRLDAADTLARVYLANGDLEKCSSILEDRFLFGAGPTDVSRYGKRCAATTRAKVLLRKGHLQEALRWLTELEPHAKSAGDDAFGGLVHLLAAQALYRMGKGPECARQILKSDQTSIRTMLDLQGQLQYSLAEMVSDSVGLRTQLTLRANRIWATQGVVAVRLEIDSARDSSDERPADAARADERSVVNHLAACVRLRVQPVSLRQRTSESTSII